MRNISKIQRLISGFKRQNRQTVLSHLDTMADDPVVFSKHLKGIDPHLKSNDIYLYIDHWCIVVVCLDCIERKDELADDCLAALPDNEADRRETRRIQHQPPHEGRASLEEQFHQRRRHEGDLGGDERHGH